MNINLGDSNHIVRYIQKLLQENYNNKIIVTGTYDRSTHNSFIDYMYQSDSINMRVLLRHMKEDFPYIVDNFKINEGSNEITLTSKTSNYNVDIENFMTQAKTELLYYFDDYGWQITDYNGYIAPYKIIVKSKKIYAPFPREDFHNMVNLFTGRFQYNLAIRDDSGVSDIVHETITKKYGNAGNYKITVISVKPNVTYYITHNGSFSTHLIMGTSVVDFKDIRDVPVKDVVEVDLSPGHIYEYTTTSGAVKLIIQCPCGKLTEPINGEINNFLVTRGDIDKVPVDDFILEPWSIHDKFVTHILNYGINTKSDQDYIYYIQRMVQVINDKYDEFYIGNYDDNLKNYVQNIQKEYDIKYQSGYIDVDTETILVDLYELLLSGGLNYGDF